MKKFLFIFLFIFFITRSLGAEEKLSLVASVNSAMITNIDILNEINVIKLLNKSVDTNSQVVSRVALKNAVDEILKNSEIKKNAVKISSKNLIDQQYAELLKKITEINGPISKIIKEKIYNKIQLDYEWNTLVAQKYSWKININMNEIDEKLKNEKIEDPSKLLAAKENLLMTEKKKKLNIYSNNYLSEIRKKSLIKFF